MERQGNVESATAETGDSRQQATHPVADTTSPEAYQPGRAPDRVVDPEMQQLAHAIETLHLSDLKKQFLRNRWLGQLIWMDDKAKQAQRNYYVLRLTTIIGGVIVPALVTLSVTVSSDSRVIVGVVTWVISLLVAITAALEEFFHFGDRWRHYRRTAEQLKIEGWRYLQLTKPYQGQSHAEAMPAFAERVETTAEHEVDVYITEVVREREETKERETAPASNASSPARTQE